jgi:hypothetical protein
MATIVLPYPTFVFDTTIDQNQMNANNAAILAQVNGNLDNTNISASANIAISKINLSAGGAAFNKSTTGVTTWASGLTTDTQPQIAMTTDKGLRFGPGGVTTVDVELIRSAAKTLQLNDTASGAATLDMNGSNMIALSALALKNTNSATITPASLGADRAIAFPDPGGAASLFCGNSALANHSALTFDGSIIQGIAPGTSGNKLTSNGTDWISVAPYQSTAQTISTAGALTLTHGLGYTPLNVWFALVNVTGEAGYTTGQIVYQGGVTTGTTGQGFSCIVDGTHLTIRFGSATSVFSVPHATTGVTTALTNGDWTVTFFAA